MTRSDIYISAAIAVLIGIAGYSRANAQARPGPPDPPKAEAPETPAKAGDHAAQTHTAQTHTANSSKAKSHRPKVSRHPKGDLKGRHVGPVDAAAPKTH